MSDFSLKTKIVNGIYKFVSEKQGTLPLYYGNDVPDYIPADTLSAKKKISIFSTDNREGIFREPAFLHRVNEKALHHLILKLSKDKRINLAGFGMLMDGRVVAEYFTPPYLPKYRHVSYSLCKSILAMAVGIAVDKGYFSTEDKLCEIFPEHSGIFFKRGMKDVTIHHLLTMTAGVNFDEVSAYFHFDWCKEYMGSDLSFEPGSDFFYNSLNTYMLAAVVTKKTGQSVMDFLTEHLFTPMGISDITWDKCPKGIERGGWGMKLSMVDMLKLGQLYLSDGVWTVNGEKIRLVDKKWIEKSLECHVTLDEKRVVRGYGYHIWLLKDGSFLFNGVFGQNVYVNRKRNMVIGITASSYDIFPDGRLMEHICRFAADDRNFMPRIYPSLALIQKQNRLIQKKNGLLKSQGWKKSLDFLRKNLDEYLGNQYKFKEYASSILPISSQMFYSNYQIGIESLSIDIKQEKFILTVLDSGKKYRIILGYSENQPYVHQILEIGGKKMPIAATGRVVFDEDERMMLYIRLVYPEEIGNRVFKLYFHSDGMDLYAYETPNMMEFAGQLLQEDKMRRTQMLGKWQAPDYLKFKIQKILSPHAKGYLDE